jgi:Transglycosylase SLT domain
MPTPRMAAISFLCKQIPCSLLLSVLFLSAIFAAMPVSAQTTNSGSITATTDESGRRIYVNGDSPHSSDNSAGAKSEGAAPRSPLVYWSSTEHRFKPVPTNGAAMRAARSAASEVDRYIDGKARNYQTLNRAFTQQEIDSLIDAAAARHNVDPSLVRSVVKVESNFNPNAVSRKGAMGLMQLMPSTARTLKVANPFDPEQNVDAGVRHLRKLLDSYGGNVPLTLAAYNAGSGAVARSAGIPRFRETQEYVRRITTLYNSGADAYVVGASHDPVRVERDARGMLFISNTE